MNVHANIHASDNTRISQLVMERRPGSFIGYSEASQRHFEDGFNWAVERLFGIEMRIIGDSIVEELGLRNEQWGEYE